MSTSTDSSSRQFQINHVTVTNDVPGAHLSTEAVTNSLECALAVLQDNVMRNQRGFKEFWHLSAAYNYTIAQSVATDSRKLELEREAWERVAALLYRVTAAQKNSAVANGTLSQAESLIPSIAPGDERWPDASDISQWDFDDVWNLDFTHAI
ncbi:hypothetical protein N0V90_006765 [Kalmusia sp. IMI 367209]|nr:hypothetical protein N0V90_006765 [Kalmusia sp. IMI 367209]